MLIKHHQKTGLPCLKFHFCWPMSKKTPCRRKVHAFKDVSQNLGMENHLFPHSRLASGWILCLGSPLILVQLCSFSSGRSKRKGLLLEHRGVSQHIGQDEVSDLRATQVDLSDGIGEAGLEIRSELNQWVTKVVDFYHIYLVGGWATPMKNMKVNWDD